MPQPTKAQKALLEAEAMDNEAVDVDDTDIPEPEYEIEAAPSAMATADPAAEANLAAVMADPTIQAAMAKMIDAAVAARMTQAAAPQSEMTQLVAMMGKMLEVNASQMPGYFKPLPQDVVESRLQGRVDMFTLLKSYKDAGTPPAYFVGPNGFYGGSVEYKDGEPIRMYLPPTEDMVPCFDDKGDPQAGFEAGSRAVKVLEAQRRWLGTPTRDIADQLSDALIESHNVGRSAVPMVGDETTIMPAGPVVAVDTDRRMSENKPAFAHMGETVMPTGGQPTSVLQGRGPKSGPAQGPSFVDAG